MIDFVEEYTKRCSDLGVPDEQYKRYVDDELKVTYEIKPGVRYIDNKLIMDPSQVEIDLRVPGDLRTFKVLQEIGNSIIECIDLEIDVPSSNLDNKLPVLDVKVWIEENRILWEFYKKPISNKMTIHKRTAVPYKDKRQTVLQEALRRLRNTHPDLGDTVRDKHLTEYSKSMKLSGWNETERHQVIKGALNIYQEERNKHRRGERQLYRNKVERQKDKEKKLDNNLWFMKGGHTSTLKLNHTPGDKLATMVKSFVTKTADGGKARILSQAGQTILSKLTNKNPRGNNTKTVRLTPQTEIEWSADKGQIAQTGVTYRVSCNLCHEDNKKTHYEGETGKNLVQRARIHLQDLKTDRQENPLTTHKQTHGGRYDYDMTIDRSYRLAKDRQISEGLNIEKTKADYLLNSKSEFNQPRLVRWRDRLEVDGVETGLPGARATRNYREDSETNTLTNTQNIQSCTDSSQNNTPTTQARTDLQTHTR